MEKMETAPDWQETRLPEQQAGRRVLARALARELTLEELESVSGGAGCSSRGSSDVVVAY